VHNSVDFTCLSFYVASKSEEQTLLLNKE